MNRNRALFIGAVLFIIFFLHWAGPGSCAVNATQTGTGDQQMSDFSLSGFGDKGKKSWDIAGKSADIGTEIIKLNDIVSNFYGDQETVKLTADNGNFNRLEGNIHLQDDVVVTTSSGARMTTDVLDWDRKRQIVQTSSAVRVQKNNIDITGLGAKGFPDLKKIDLNKDVKVNIDQAETAGPSGKALKKIVITCDGSLQVDYSKNIATFNDNVRAVTADGVITGDHIELYFMVSANASDKGKSQDDMSAMAGSRIERILARGNVVITRGENVSYSDEASYSALENKITLLGRPKLVIYSSEGFNAPVGN
jgi:LPS export ABC transporter protein LptC